MAWTAQPPPSTERTAAEAGLPDHLLALLSSAAGYFRARVELAGLEGREAVLAYGKVAALFAAAALVGGFAYVFLWIGLIAVASYYAGIHWGWVTLAAGLLHLIAAAACLWGARALWGTPVFTETLDQFRKDQQWLASPRQTARHD